MTDSIFVTGLVVHANHGVGDDEGRIGQQFLIDLALGLDLSKAAQSDKLVDTVSYAEMIEVASGAFRARRYRLVEAAASAVMEAIFAAFPSVRSVRITIHKPHVPIAAVFSDVGVTFERTRRG